jgi:magnesium transporter
MHGFMELQRYGSFLAPSGGSSELLRDLISHADRGLKLLAQMESRLRDLRQHLQQCLQESTNRRLNMLAILSAIYMPATLIAGIYGMNFEHIPITQLPYGYFIVLLIMAALVLGQLWFFYRRGWFR